MEIIRMISTVLGLVLLMVGLIVFLLEIIGIIKYKYLLNRMHAAGMGDTFGIFSCLFGMVLISGFNFTSAKLILVIIFLWFASPTATHLISKMEASTNEDIGSFAKIDIEDKEEK